MCGDSEWGLADAQVTCRQLELPAAGANNLIVSAVPDTARVIWLNNVRCVGTENSLFNSFPKHNRNNYCKFNCFVQVIQNNYCRQSDAGVSCQASK